MYQHKDLHKRPIYKPCLLYIPNDPNIQPDDSKSSDFPNGLVDKSTLDGRQWFLDTLHLYRRDCESILGYLLCRRLRQSCYNTFAVLLYYHSSHY